MDRSKNVVVLLCSLLLLLLLAGCAASVPLAINRGLRDHHTNGEVAVFTPVTNNTGIFVAPGINMYSLVYWSRGHRVQAYVDVPPGKGPFPLIIYLHGGYQVPEPLPGQSFHVDYWAVTPRHAAFFSQYGMVSFIPNFSGYGPSHGSIGDAHDNYLDTMDGLRALSHLSAVHLEHKIFLIGTSMGGGVAMFLAERLTDVRAMELISPYPGAHLFMGWMESQRFAALDTQDQAEYLDFFTTHGSNLSTKWYSANSVAFRLIDIPVLIIAGSKDPILPPALEILLYHHIRKHDRQVQIRFYPEGHDPVEASALTKETQWFTNNGLPNVMPWE